MHLFWVKSRGKKTSLGKFKTVNNVYKTETQLERQDRDGLDMCRRGTLDILDKAGGPQRSFMDVMKEDHCNR